MHSKPTAPPQPIASTGSELVMLRFGNRRQVQVALCNIPSCASNTGTSDNGTSPSRHCEYRRVPLDRWASAPCAVQRTQRVGPRRRPSGPIIAVLTPQHPCAEVSVCSEWRRDTGSEGGRRKGSDPNTSSTYACARAECGHGAAAHAAVSVGPNFSKRWPPGTHLNGSWSINVESGRNGDLDINLSRSQTGGRKLTHLDSHRLNIDSS